MWAGTVVAPGVSTMAAMLSTTSRSRSVALRLRLPPSACSMTLERIGMVFRRSTTRCTWVRDFKSSVRSSVTFMRNVHSSGRSIVPVQQAPRITNTNLPSAGAELRSPHHPNPRSLTSCGVVQTALLALKMQEGRCKQRPNNHQIPTRSLYAPMWRR